MKAKRRQAIFLLLLTLFGPVLGSSGCAQTELQSAEELLAWEMKVRAEIEAERERFDQLRGEYAELLARQEGPQPLTQEAVDRALAAAKASRERVFTLLKEADTAFRTYLKKHPDDHLVRDRWGHFLADHSLNYEAAEVWEELIRRAPDYATAPNNLGTLYTHMGRDMEAIDLFLKSIALNPNEPEFYFNLGTVYATHRKDVAAKFGWDLPRVFREMLRAFGKARELAPDNVEYAREYASSFIMAKYFGVSDTADEAIAAWEHYLKLNLTPDQRAFGLNRLAFIYLREKGDKKRAAELLRESIRVSPVPLAEDMLRECETEK